MTQLICSCPGAKAWRAKRECRTSQSSRVNPFERMNPLERQATASNHPESYSEDHRRTICLATALNSPENQARRTNHARLPNPRSAMISANLSQNPLQTSQRPPVEFRVRHLEDHAHQSQSHRRLSAVNFSIWHQWSSPVPHGPCKV
jgi:hypothetical protein